MKPSIPFEDGVNEMISNIKIGKMLLCGITIQLEKQQIHGLSIYLNNK